MWLSTSQNSIYPTCIRWTSSPSNAYSEKRVLWTTLARIISLMYALGGTLLLIRYLFLNSCPCLFCYYRDKYSLTYYRPGKHHDHHEKPDHEVYWSLLSQKHQPANQHCHCQGKYTVTQHTEALEKRSKKIIYNHKDHKYSWSVSWDSFLHGFLCSMDCDLPPNT